MSVSHEVRSDARDVHRKRKGECRSDFDNLLEILRSFRPQRRTLASHFSQAAFPHAGTSREHANVGVAFDSAARKTFLDVAGLERKDETDNDAESIAARIRSHRLPQLD